MATTTINLQKTSTINSPFLNNHQINQVFDSNPFSYFKFPIKIRFTPIKCYQSNPSTTILPLKPFLKPLITPSPEFRASEPLFFGGTQIGAARRVDFRAWSRRRPGSSSKKNRVTVALECTGCSGYRYVTEKRRVATEKKKENKKVNTGEGLLLSKYCPKCRKHFLHKEVKLGSSK